MSRAGLARHGVRRDACEKGIVWTLRKAGCIVYPLSGSGVPDLLVSTPWTGVSARVLGFEQFNFLLECKDADKGELTKAQREFAAIWHGLYHIVSSPRDALIAVTASDDIQSAALIAYEAELLKPKARQFK